MLNAPLGTATDEKKPNDALRVIISYVTEHYPEKITLNDISARIGFSKEYFCRFFKQHMGITFLQYLNELKIESQSDATWKLSLGGKSDDFGACDLLSFKNEDPHTCQPPVPAKNPLPRKSHDRKMYPPLSSGIPRHSLHAYEENSR